MKQYVTANRYKNQIYVRELVDGVEYRRKVRFQPYIFQRSSKPTEYKDFYGNGYVKKVTFQNPFEMKEHIDLYKDIPGELWGNKDIVAQFMYDEKYDCYDQRYYHGNDTQRQRHRHKYLCADGNYTFRYGEFLNLGKIKKGIVLNNLER